jgi:hypothetical protein
VEGTEPIDDKAIDPEPEGIKKSIGRLFFHEGVQRYEKPEGLMFAESEHNRLTDPAPLASKKTVIGAGSSTTVPDVS